jgi:hypothetical protein
VLCAVLLVGSGFIEGFVSPDPSFPMASRIVIGIGYWLIMWAVLTGRLLKNRAASSAASAPEIRIGGKHGML